ncbi:murein hydrolase activator EnvC family protein [Saccharopolyspora montiporae]|uniref:murein hydrolase activator EnvC family protein n=1 Tax=Saccharopolyspora montiporae TaxID=2781240 RepID=UPI00351C2439
MPNAVPPLVRTWCALCLLLICSATAFAVAAPPPAPRPAAGPAPAGGLRWPLDPPPEVLRPFEEPDVPFGPGHRGVDLLAGPGQPVLAAGPGRVVHAGVVAGRGVVSVQHHDDLRTTYEPVHPGIAAGAEVDAGQQIAEVAPDHAGCSAPPGAACLHWGARQGARYEDPLRLVTSGRVRLLPWTDAPGTGGPA